MAEGLLATVPFDFGAPAGTKVGLSIAKLIEASRLFRKAGADVKGAEITIGADQETDLFRQVRVASVEFGDRPRLDDGRVTRFLGFGVEVWKDADLDKQGSIRECFASAGNETIVIQCYEKD